MLNNSALYQIFKKYNGIFSCQNKVQIPDNLGLSLAYTPGVGSCCIAITKDSNLGYIYTNKANSIFIVTDSSGFPDFEYEKWNNAIPIPFVEARATYFKIQANIDAYPLVLDYSKVKNAKDLLEIIVKLSPAYSGFDLFRISVGRIKKLKKLYNELEKKPEVVLFTTKEEEYLKYKLNQKNFKTKNIFHRMVIASIFRAALDTRSFGFIDKEVIDYVIKDLKNIKDIKLLDNNFYLSYRMIISASDFFIQNQRNTIPEITIKCISDKFQRFLVEGKRQWAEPLPDEYNNQNLSKNEKSLLLHQCFKGLCEVHPQINIKDPKILDQLFSFDQLNNIADLLKINPDIANDITCKRNLSAIITNGTAILGFGDIGNIAGLPVMEGKACIFKKLGGVNLMPICIDEKNPEKLIDIIEKIAPIFGAINLEDIKSPECFQVESYLKKHYCFPIFHDDQYGTAIVTLAGLINSLKITKRKIAETKIIINGGGAAGLSIVKLLLEYGAQHIICCDTTGAIFKGRQNNMNQYKNQMAELTNQKLVEGTLEEVIQKADVFIGVSAGNVVSQEMVASMNEKSIVFAMANPIPEIYPDKAKEAGAFIVATGRSDFPNQINNCLVFPGLFRGALDIRAKQITMSMNLAASIAIADSVSVEQLCPEYIVPNALDQEVPLKVALAVAEIGINEKLNKRELTIQQAEDEIKNFLIEGTLRSLPKNKTDFIKYLQLSKL